MLARLRKGLTAVHWKRQPSRLLSAMNTILRRGRNNGKVGSDQLPKRKQQVTSLRNEHFDVLVIGGGAIGCGCALEATTRGFKTALIEAEDFASGASCKSSKLIEGSNSYLHAAIQGADLQQIFMLQQVLNERATMLTIAPHLNRVQPMLIPIYSPLRLPLYWLGLKMYDAMAGMSNVRGSHFLSKEATLNEFPLLRRNGLLGSLVYYDVQLDDARMCLALAMTAAKHGATVANYVRLHELMPPTGDNGCRTVRVEDTVNDSCFTINSRVVINSTGANTDVVRQLDDSGVSPISVPKMGTHVALPSYYGSQNCGLLFPSDQTAEQALIMLPFENSMLVGSLDVERPESSEQTPTPAFEEVECLLAQTRRMLEQCVQLRSGHVMSAWTGIKPSIMCPSVENKEDEEPNTVSNYLLEVSGNQMITLAGGRWSTYRVMALDAINTAIEICQLEPHTDSSITKNLLLDGANDFCCMLPLDLVQAYDLPMDVAQHLADSYGTNASHLLANSCRSGRQRLHPKFPYIQAEVTYACQREYACHLVDVIARRLRVAFVNVTAAAEMLPTVLDLMSEELFWKKHKKEQELRAAQYFLAEQMGLGSIVKQKKQFKFRESKAPEHESTQVNQQEYNRQSLNTNSVQAVLSSVPKQASTDMKSRLSSQMETNATSVGFRGIAAPVSSEYSPMRVQACIPAPLKSETIPTNDSANLETKRSPSSTPSDTVGESVPVSTSLSPSTSIQKPNVECVPAESTPTPLIVKKKPKVCSFSPYVIAGSEPKGPGPGTTITSAGSEEVSGLTESSSSNLKDTTNSIEPKTNYDSQSMAQCPELEPQQEQSGNSKLSASNVTTDTNNVASTVKQEGTAHIKEDKERPSAESATVPKKSVVNIVKSELVNSGNKADCSYTNSTTGSATALEGSSKIEVEATVLEERPSAESAAISKNSVVKSELTNCSHKADCGYTTSTTGSASALEGTSQTAVEATVLDNGAAIAEPTSGISRLSVETDCISSMTGTSAAPEGSHPITDTATNPRSSADNYELAKPAACISIPSVVAVSEISTSNIVSGTAPEDSSRTTDTAAILESAIASLEVLEQTIIKANAGEESSNTVESSSSPTCPSADLHKEDGDKAVVARSSNENDVKKNPTGSDTET
ncbi:glycerol-3-phosphate dehydrogenase, mitochondrial [Drosophila novamexicana]|uniref:glycerol-3-phosphate dehydrogenase, mitochondrial n=1 Tax=Drosophila novamexicana TaxID=47314 RepID=UPI0011E5FCE0|nr:glycerol-3-phosphate dehydrogenase, mitochondrial [Drosophila novamexicana]